jgi:hypothetical protein
MCGYSASTSAATISSDWGTLSKIQSWIAPLEKCKVSRNMPCPFCGSSNVIIDTLNYTSGKPGKYRAWCQGCHVCDTSEEAWAAWNSRVPTAPSAAEDINLLINKNTFILHSRAYCRNPETGNCTAQKEFRGKALRIKENVFLSAYRECEEICRKVKT